MLQPDNRISYDANSSSGMGPFDFTAGAHADDRCQRCLGKHAQKALRTKRQRRFIDTLSCNNFEHRLLRLPLKIIIRKLIDSTSKSFKLTGLVMPIDIGRTPSLTRTIPLFPLLLVPSLYLGFFGSRLSIV